MKAQAYMVPVVVLKFCSTSFFLWVRKFMADEFGEPIEESMAGTHWRKSDLQWSFSPYAKPTSFFVRKSGNVWIVSLWLFFFKFWKYYPFFIQTWLVRFSFLQFCHFFLVPKTSSLNIADCTYPLKTTVWSQSQDMSYHQLKSLDLFLFFIYCVIYLTFVFSPWVLPDLLFICNCLLILSETGEKFLCVKVRQHQQQTTIGFYWEFLYKDPDNRMFD